MACAVRAQGWSVSGSETIGARAEQHHPVHVRGVGLLTKRSKQPSRHLPLSVVAASVERIFRRAVRRRARSHAPACDRGGQDNLRAFPDAVHLLEAGRICAPLRRARATWAPRCRCCEQARTRHVAHTADSARHEGSGPGQGLWQRRPTRRQPRQRVLPAAQREQPRGCELHSPRRHPLEVTAVTAGDLSVSAWSVRTVAAARCLPAPAM
jgi:hypothetical protein